MNRLEGSPPRKDSSALAVKAVRTCGLPLGLEEVSAYSAVRRALALGRAATMMSSEIVELARYHAEWTMTMQPHGPVFSYCK